MSELRMTVHCTIHDGKLDEFQQVAAACLKSVEDKDTRTLDYRWFFNEDKSVCAILERYPDSDSLLEHLANLGETFGKLLGICELSVEMYGEPSAALLEATSGVPVKVYRFFQGA
jgi:quinol monooxygenase YgiN